MCNAFNHSSDCGCGFGPPYTWQVITGPRTNWPDNALFSDSAFKKAFNEFNIDPDIVKSTLENYYAKGYPIPRNIRGSLTTKQRTEHYSFIKRLFLKTEEIESIEKRYEIPLFILHSPKVRNSKVTYSRTYIKENQISWRVKILGFGTGADQVFIVRNSSTFTSSKGNFQVVFLPIKLQITLMNVRYGKGDSKKALRIESSPDQYQRKVNLGVKSKKQNEIKDLLIKDKKNYEEFFLAKDITKDISKFIDETVKNNRHNYGIDVNFLNQQGKCIANINREVAIELTSELPGGHDYIRTALKYIDGHIWEKLSN